MKPQEFAPIIRKIIPPFFFLWVRKINGLHHLPKKGPFIIASNHASYIEHGMIGSIILLNCNAGTHFIAKKEHFEAVSQKTWHSLWKKYITYIPIDRAKGEDALKKAVNHLKKGAILVIYPEGTRTLTGKLQKGKTGVARLALWTKVPVVPVGFTNTFNILPKGKNIPSLQRTNINIGKPLTFESYRKKQFSKKVLREVTDTIMKEIAKLSHQKYTH